MMAPPVGFWVVMAFLLGACVGSFLNVVIYRLPIASKDLNLNQPRWSFCPHCQHRLMPWELVPLISFLLLGRRCRTCKRPIAWRYFGVELLTATLFAALVWFTQANPATAVALLAFTAVLVPIAFIDLERFEIPLSLTLLSTLIPLARDLWGVLSREPAHELLWGWMPRSALGALIGVLIFGTVRVAGWLWKRVEAMGLGDVLLARGIGAMLIAVTPAGAHPLRLFPVWVLLSCLSGIVVGYPIILWRNRQQEGQELHERAENSAQDAAATDTQGTLWEQLRDIGWCLWLGDLGEYWRSVRGQQPAATDAPEAEEWRPEPSAIPFGPFLAIGFLATVFLGEWLTKAYLDYAFPPAPPGP
ncbi:MAG: prepilin peptidase [Chloroherpetonaceae bacterium]|nr:prepilin peptidase [Chthonomonadaceae bacterium]MDW8207955.1 prepilin peptidase [Chloroherpetonaceae bacterium]